MNQHAATSSDRGRSDGQLNGQPREAHVSNGFDASSPRERCELLGIDWFDEAPETSADAVAAITADIAVRLRVVPVRFENHRLVVAMVDPLDMAAADEVSALTGKPITRIGLEQEASMPTIAEESAHV